MLVVLVPVVLPQPWTGAGPVFYLLTFVFAIIFDRLILPCISWAMKGSPEPQKAQKNKKSLLPDRRLVGVSLGYQISTEKFVGKKVYDLDDGPHDRWKYSYEIPVEKQWDYPEIPQSQWTVSICVENCWNEHGGYSGMKPIMKITPSEDCKSLTSPYSIVVVGEIRVSNRYTTGCSVISIGPDGWAHSSAPKDDVKLTDLLCCKFRPDREGNYSHKYPALLEGNIYVILTFHVGRYVRSDLKHLWESKALADSTLVSTDDQTFPVHRDILAAQSPVFAGLWPDIKTEAKGVGSIPDISGELLSILLNFAYTRELSHNANGKLEELWKTAKEFGMKELSAACESRMISIFDQTNALRYFAFAREHGLVKLQRMVGTYIGKNPMAV
ncbi:uncharacterized protein LOC129598892 isoform X1 [Paramacrobiotus metropolitanus]|uniref:uncharacterized protein LOC129598892 isoform X1 n=1 Tax=Paramacrobiotus metropolitanus TaxID=2943436 RepID=UPI002445942B|nr:uncharacterized protein LOC129598892 isoform X1 [Paramacrobiotus metropolitanus]